YGYIKNHMKTVKNKQARTRERKSEQKPEATSSREEAQMHPKENDMLAILRCPQFDQTADNSSSNDWKMNGRD
ncbi:hypothetical protein Tco_0191805, partial [Tanacetum coccineum]